MTIFTTTHVYWTEFAYCGGIIPFAAILCWLAMVIKDMMDISFRKEVLLKEKMLLILPLVAVILYACTEALRDMFTPFLIMLFAGMLRGKILAENMLKKDK